MASNAAKAAVGGVMEISKKYTLQSEGIWERIRRVFAIDANRSNGVPLNPQFRNPPPGSLDPLGYDDPVTVPAGDIAGNPYWKRDSRRAYPQLSVVNQPDMVSLLTVGSAAAPKVELIGDAGQQQLVAAKEAGSQGLATYLENPTTAKDTAQSFFVNGLPPLPSGESLKKDGQWDVYNYKMTEDQSYKGK